MAMFLYPKKKDHYKSLVPFLSLKINIPFKLPHMRIITILKISSRYTSRLLKNQIEEIHQRKSMQNAPKKKSSQRKKKRRSSKAKVCNQFQRMMIQKKKKKGYHKVKRSKKKERRNDISVSDKSV